MNGKSHFSYFAKKAVYSAILTLYYDRFIIAFDALRLIYQMFIGNQVDVRGATVKISY